jgi:TolB-like protein/Flp pilus assembly protein TadD
MSSPDWNQIKQAFAAALAVSPDERQACLDSACEGRPDIRAAVEDLLRANAEASNSFLEPSTLVISPAWQFRQDDLVAGRFRVVKRIARGSMGEVYQVRDEQLHGVCVALKAIRPELLGDADTVDRFRREVTVTRAIPHKGLCRIIDLVEHTMGPNSGYPPGTVVPCLTMEYLEGESLEEFLARSRPMAPEDALPLIRQVGEALQVLHGARVIHRDLKPSNVMLVETAEGIRAVLTDFGLAKPTDEGVFETQVRAQGGAPFFMAPELLVGERPSYASDIYAFGLVIDEMVTSTQAFSADSLAALLLHKLSGGPTRPSERSTVVSRVWERTILRCVEPDPRDRFATAGEVLDSLEGKKTRRGWGRLWRWPGRSRKLRASHVAAYVMVAVGLVLAAATLGQPLEPASTTSVVIRPFASFTQKRELDYLATGTTGELGRRLSRVRTLRVYSSSEEWSANDSTLSATYAVRGNIQEVGGRLRVTVELADGQKGALLWSSRIDGSVAEALQIQDQLAAETVGALTRLQGVAIAGRVQRIVALFTRFLPYHEPLVPSSGTTSNVAFDAYLRGRTLFEERTVPSALRAIDYLKRALKEDPNYAVAYATLADVQGVLMDLHYAPQATLLAEAERYASQAVALRPDVPDVQLTLGAVRQMQWRWGEAEEAYKRAIDLHPTSARAHRWYGGLLLQFGKFDEGLEKHRQALDLDPSDYPSHSAYGHALFQAGRVKEAAEQWEGLLTRKDLFYAHALLGQAYAYMSRPDQPEAAAYLAKALQRAAIVREKDAAAQDAPGGGHSDYADLIEALAWSYQGRTDAAEPFLARLFAGHTEGRVSAGMLARVYAAQGDTVKAIGALLDAEARHERELYYINVSPFYQGIRQEPQIRELVDRIGLTR